MSFREWAENQGRLGSGKSAKVRPRNNTKRKLPLNICHQHTLDGSAAMSSFSNLGPFLRLVPLSLKGWQRKFMSPFVLGLCRETNQYDTILFYWLWMLKSLKFLGQAGSLEIPRVWCSDSSLKGVWRLNSFLFQGLKSFLLRPSTDGMKPTHTWRVVCSTLTLLI